MILRIVVAVLIGGGVGLAIGLTGSRLGGQCPLMCNPYVSTALGIVVGLLIASGGGGVIPSGPNLATPSSEADYRFLVDQPGSVVLVEFYTRNCPSCYRQAPAIVALSDRYAGRATVAAVDANRLTDVVRAEGISGVPTTLIFRDGERVETLDGLTGEEELSDLIDKHLAAGGPPAEPTTGESEQ